MGKSAVYLPICVCKIYPLSGPVRTGGSKNARSGSTFLVKAFNGFSLRSDSMVLDYACMVKVFTK